MSIKQYILSQPWVKETILKIKHFNQMIRYNKSKLWDAANAMLRFTLKWIYLEQWKRKTRWAKHIANKAKREYMQNPKKEENNIG